MTSTIANPNTLRFLCPHCQAELGVPSSMAGLTAPCPSCSQLVQAPLVGRTVLVGETVGRKTPSPEDMALSSQCDRPKEIPAALPAKPISSLSEPPLPFHAKHVMLPTQAAPDTSWQEPYRRRQAVQRFHRKAEKMAEKFLNSRFFWWFRFSFFLLGTVFVLYTYWYMKKNAWRPWWVKVPAAVSEKAR